MLLTHILPLLPFALAAPTKSELTVSQWTAIQSGFEKLTDWSFSTAQDVVHELSEIGTNGNEELTIWQQLKADPHSFSRLTKLIEFEGKAIKYLDDKDLQITFFAPNNDALEPPHDHHHHNHDHHDLWVANLIENPSLTTLSSLLDAEPNLTGDDDDDEDKQRRKEVFRYIAGKVLQYHGLPKAYTAKELAENVTFATALKADDGSYGGLHRRIRIDKQLIPPALKINFYAKVLTSDGKARNGIVHTLDHPLLPPPSIFTTAYLFPDFYSTATTAIQGTHGRHYLDWQYTSNFSHPPKKDGSDFKGTGLATFFLPDNKAFLELPLKLKFFLFSPFGENALKKVLAYHYLPNTLLLSEFLYVAKEKKESWDLVDEIAQMEEFKSTEDNGFHKEIIIAPALPNSTLKIEIDKTKVFPIDGAVKTTIKVNGQYVTVIDVPAANGAFHVISKILVPPHKHHDHHGVDISSMDSWTNWEQWLPAWAAEA